METACVIAFFGFLRCGEFTVLQSFDPDSNVCSEDITINDDHPTLHLKSSKNRSFPLRNKYTSVCYWIISLSSVIVEEIYRNEKLFNHG